MRDEVVATETDEAKPEMPLGRQTQALIHAICIGSERMDPKTSADVFQSIWVVLSEVWKKITIKRSICVVQRTIAYTFSLQIRDLGAIRSNFLPTLPGISEFSNPVESRTGYRVCSLEPRWWTHLLLDLAGYRVIEDPVVHVSLYNESS